MFLLMIALASSPAFADSLHLPPEMRQQVDAADSAITEGMRSAHHKVRQAGQESDLAKAVLTDLGKLWAGLKSRSRSALVYLDHELHQHVLGPDSEPRSRD